MLYRGPQQSCWSYCVNVTCYYVMYNVLRKCIQAIYLCQNYYILWNSMSHAKRRGPTCSYFRFVNTIRSLSLLCRSDSRVILICSLRTNRSPVLHHHESRLPGACRRGGVKPGAIVSAEACVTTDRLYFWERWFLFLNWLIFIFTSPALPLFEKTFEWVFIFKWLAEICTISHIKYCQVFPKLHELKLYTSEQVWCVLSWLSWWHVDMLQWLHGLLCSAILNTFYVYWNNWTTLQRWNCS